MSLRKTLLLASLALGFACSSPDKGPDTLPADDCDGRGEPIVAGLSRTSSEGYGFELVALTPDRPIQASSSPGNHWLIRVTDKAGAKVSNAALNITTFMPDHDHPGPPAVAIETDEGDYDVDELFFPMPGLYIVTFSLASASSAERPSVMLNMCLGVKSG